MPTLTPSGRTNHCPEYVLGACEGGHSLCQFLSDPVEFRLVRNWHSTVIAKSRR